tara:strand:- start:465 stop:632 length:168 start_codon:yes stop_codon:yes gene_type:complete
MRKTPWQKGWMSFSKKLEKVEGRIENNKNDPGLVVIVFFATQLTQFFGLLYKLKF